MEQYTGKPLDFLPNIKPLQNANSIQRDKKIEVSKLSLYINHRFQHIGSELKAQATDCTCTLHKSVKYGQPAPLNLLISVKERDQLTEYTIP